MPERRRVLPLLVLALVLALGWWISRPEPARQADRARDDAPGPPLYEVVDARFRQFNAEGRLISRLDSPRVVFDDDTRMWTLETPLWQRSAEDDEVQWVGRASRGTLLGDRTRAELVGDVTLARQREGGPPVTLSTQVLHLRPEAGYAETDRPVTIEGPGWHTEGVGARAWLDRQTLEVLADVRSRFDAANR